MNIGDLIDAYDSTKVWYTSIIADREERMEGDNMVLYYKVGFRLYHEEGTKVDNNKRRFFGWSETFDEWISAYNPRI
jgi:hypothetical protein